MAKGKRYYWMKLKESFMSSDSVDYIMSQPNGAEYVLIYQMLCLKTINTNGRLSRKIGEVIIPYDSQKLARDLKYFEPETIQNAIDLYKSLGLIYDDNGVLAMTDHENLVGSETDWAEQKRKQNNSDAPVENFQEQPEKNGGKTAESSVEIFHTEIEIEKEKDIRDRDRNNNHRDGGRAKNSFKPPTREEVKAFCKQRNSPIDPDRFFDFFDTGNWIDSKGNPVRNWKQKLITWERREVDHNGRKPDAANKPVSGKDPPEDGGKGKFANFKYDV